ncbi:G patch domain and ankyrin repeat-containing protein 1-like [Plakobranchus ocellatus]|uniref:G patch domain and ankyrin repeat-containing protein 1-like n=1 Tax=Plakobranchus ocellatus TaxID=259542 RepID=A0AAV4BW65_9GAST|nr:G patch domain and ankyrin repeat-containing protein 1-like [Plakobranchus ocellatus]
MAHPDPAYRNLIQFVPERSLYSDKQTKKEITNESRGEDIKSFYELVIGATEQLNTPTKPKLGRHDCQNDHVISSLTSKTKSNPESQRSKLRRQKTTAKSANSEICLNSDVKIKSSNEAETASTSAANFGSSQFQQTLTRFERKHFKFLQASQLGDTREVGKLLQHGVDLNFKDFYGWTALMCAAKEGHSSVVMHLLQNGADSMLANNDGQTASVLAHSAGFADLAKAISSFLPPSKEKGTPIKDITVGSFYCDICKEYFSECERQAHLSSTIHLFSMGRKPQHTAYLLPETNRGFQMLLRTGWDVDQGLGPNGKGIKYPVKTVLKRDREGLGNGSNVKKKAKITHFNPCDTAAITAHTSNPGRNISIRKSAQYAVRSKERKQRCKEISLRQEFRDI